MNAKVIDKKQTSHNESTNKTCYTEFFTSKETGYCCVFFLLKHVTNYFFLQKNKFELMTQLYKIDRKEYIKKQNIYINNNNTKVET